MSGLNKYYPAMLRMKGKRTVVVGGGSVATRKIGTLLNAEAEITVISAETTDRIIEWGNKGQLVLRSKRFEDGDLKGSFLIIAATNNPEVNLQAYRAAGQNQLINIIDRPDLSNFIVPSSFTRGKLTISVSTSGASPVLSRKIKTELSSSYDEAYEEYIDFLDDCRKKVKEEINDVNVRGQILKKLVHPQFLEMTRLNKYNEREETFLKLLSEEK
jgi:precorrin-2 dehydrogenase/sirohydrochlorin ferrochelatase